MWHVGDITIDKVVEIEGPVQAGGTGSVLPDATPAAVGSVPWLAPTFATHDGRLHLSVHTLVVATPSSTVIVDTGIGNGRHRSNPLYNMLETDFLSRLELVAGPRQSVDAVVCTHLHVDHVGWNTHRVGERWAPTFPNAAYLLAATEHDSWMQHPHGFDADIFGRDSLEPVGQAGQLEVVADDAELVPGIRFEPTPGHTPGHASILIESHGHTAVITGDVLHHPCQMARPDWTSDLDENPATARRARHDFLDRYADGNTLVIGTHFGGSSAGFVHRDGDGYRFVPA